ncbi:hypothetical protein CPB97_010549 [Podila verticillata]|nr:hypothetical protein CPB97_010549 [Podila verticillata]
MHPLILPELMAIVAKYLDLSASEARHLTRVCQAWYTVFSPTVWRECSANKAFITNEPAVRGLVKNAPHIYRLSCFDLNFLYRQALACTQLTHLTIKHNLDSDIDVVEKWNMLTGFIRHNPSLRMISVSASGQPATTDFWSVLGSCEQVELGPFQVTKHQTRVFLEGCRNIQELTVHQMTLPKHGDFFEAAQEGHWRLKRLTVYFDAPTAGLNKFLELCPHLTSLALNCSLMAREHGPAALATLLKQAHLPQLEELTLRGFVDDDELPLCLRAMTRLKTLDCSWTPFDVFSFRALQGHTATLQILRLEGSKVKRWMNQRILESCPILTELSSTPIDGYWIETGRPWVCLGLKKLVMGIIILEDYDSDRDVIRDQSKVVFRELGRLKELEVLEIGMKKVKVPFQGLDLRLVSGMRVLATMQKLKKLDFTNTRQVLYAQDIEWLKKLKQQNARLRLFGSIAADYSL